MKADSNVWPQVTALLRHATAADAARVADLLIDTRRAFMPYAPSAHREVDVRSWVASSLLATGGVIVAELDGRVVATMATAIESEASWITQMAVEPALTGRGLGTRLLGQALSTLGSPIHLWTFQQNVGARRFYERNGFVAIQFTDGRDNEERCPDVLYEFSRGADPNPGSESRPTGKPLGPLAGCAYHPSGEPSALPSVPPGLER